MRTYNVLNQILALNSMFSISQCIANLIMTNPFRLIEKEPKLIDLVQKYIEAENGRLSTIQK